MGAEAIKKLLEEIDVEKTSEELKEELETASGPEACPHPQAPGGGGSLPHLRQPPRVDDSGRGTRVPP